METNNIKTCSFCGRELTGRADKKYCDDNCRNNHHYKNKKDDGVLLIKNVNALLLQNRRILKLLSKNNNKIVVLKQDLLRNDFNFDLITNVYRTRKNEEYRVVYDYAYRCVNEEEVVLIKY